MFSNLDRISNQRIRLDLWGTVCRKKRNKILVSPLGHADILSSHRKEESVKEMRKRTEKEKEAHKNVESSKSREEDFSRRKKWSLLSSVRSKVPKIIFF